MTEKKIRSDLREIRRYYAMKEEFDRCAKEVPPTGIRQKLGRYHRAAGEAPALLYLLYVMLYVEGATQTALAEDWGYTPDYIKQLNKRLCDFLQSRFAQTEEPKKKEVQPW